MFHKQQKLRSHLQASLKHGLEESSFKPQRAQLHARLFPAPVQYPSKNKARSKNSVSAKRRVSKSSIPSEKGLGAGWVIWESWAGCSSRAIVPALCGPRRTFHVKPCVFLQAAGHWVPQSPTEVLKSTPKTLGDKCSPVPHLPRSK